MAVRDAGHPHRRHLPSGAPATQGGGQTNAFGPELYWQQIDFVTRISRVQTHWFPFGGLPSSVSSVTQEPAPELQPPGTAVIVEYRGASTIDVQACGGDDPLTNANLLDFYGDYPDSGCATLSTPTGWRSSPSSLLGQFRYFQIRFTFVSNIDQELSPELDAFGFAWSVD